MTAWCNRDILQTPLVINSTKMIWNGITIDSGKACTWGQGWWALRKHPILAPRPLFNYSGPRLPGIQNSLMSHFCFCSHYFQTQSTNDSKTVRVLNLDSHSLNLNFLWHTFITGNYYTARDVNEFMRTHNIFEIVLKSVLFNLHDLEWVPGQIPRKNSI